jgi:hypothetical protein
MTTSNDRSNCREALDWLQRRLDGANAAMPASVAEHMGVCADCRERTQAASRLLASLGARSARHMPTPLMTERIIRAVERDRRQLRLRRWAAGATALAAAIVLAVWLSNSGQRSATAPSLRRDAADAGQAVASFSKRAAIETVGESRLLVPQIEMPKIVNSSLALATAPIENTGRSLADGLAPVTNSARRAVNLFFGDPGRPSVEMDKSH